jgi:chromate transporter
MSLWPIFRLFLLLGSIGFGGPMPMLALIHQEVVERRKWISGAQFAEGVTLGQSLPGPIAVDAVSYIGYRLSGWPGAFVATVAFILPSFLLMILLSLLYFRWGIGPRGEGVLRGIGFAVIGLILAASLRMGKTTVKNPWGFLPILVSSLLLFLFHVPILLILGLGALWGVAHHIREERRRT